VALSHGADHDLRAAQAMVATGARPVLAGRNEDRLNDLAERLSRDNGGVTLETAVAGSERPGSLRELIGFGDVLVSTAGPFLASFEIDGRRRQAFSIGSSEQFALPRLRRQPPLTDVGVYLGWSGAATGLVHYASAMAAPLERFKGVRDALDRLARQIQRSRPRRAPGRPSVLMS
jgi:hypothetical protein